jgi:predicted phosphohydrolase
MSTIEKDLSEKASVWRDEMHQQELDRVVERVNERNTEIGSKFKSISDERELELLMKEQMRAAMQEAERLKAIGVSPANINRAVAGYITNIPAPANANMQAALKDMQAEMSHQIYGHLHNHTNPLKALNPFSR